MMAYAEIECVAQQAGNDVANQALRRALKLAGLQSSHVTLYGETADVLARANRLRMALAAQPHAPRISLCIKLDRLRQPEAQRLTS